MLKKTFLFLLSFSFLFLLLSFSSFAEDHIYGIHKAKILSKITKTKYLRYFEIRLNDPQNIFNKIGPYQYDNEYLKIQPFFNYKNEKGPKKMKGFLMRRVMMLEYSLSYKRKTYKYNLPMDSEENFYKIIKTALKSDLEKQKFTYDILSIKGEKILRFSPTGKGKLNYVTKHLLHSKLSKRVIYSGEFIIKCPPEKNTCHLKINNKSGSYKPSKKELSRVIDLFQSDFGLSDIEGDFEKTEY